MKANYNLHDIVNVQVNEHRVNLVEYYDHYLRFHKEKELAQEAVYTVREYDEFVPPRLFRQANNCYRGFANGLWVPGEQYAVTLDDGKITEYTNVPNRATNLWLQVLLLAKGMSFLHCAGMEIFGKSFIFPAFGGTGKTTLVSYARKDPSFVFYGDDFVIIDEDTGMYSYPSDFSIYEYHLANFPELSESRYEKYLVERRLKRARELNLAKIPGFLLLRQRLSKLNIKSATEDDRRISWDQDYVKVPVRHLIESEGIGEYTKLTHVIFLEKYSGNELSLDSIDQDEGVKEATGILDVEFRYSIIYLQLLGAFGITDYTHYVQRTMDVIRSCFSKMKIYRISIPEQEAPEKYVPAVLRILGEL